MPNIENLPQKILLILSGAGFLAVGAWFLTDQGNRSAKKSIPPSDLPLDRELGEPLGTAQTPTIPLTNQSPGSLKLPTVSSPGMPLLPAQPKTKVNIPSSPVGITIPNQTLPQPSQNFSSGTLPYIPPEPRARSNSSSFSQPSTSQRSSGSSYNGPGSLLPNIPDPLDKPQSRSAPKTKVSPLPKSEPASPQSSEVSPSLESPKDTSSTKSSSPSYAPAAPDSSIKLAPSEFSEPEPLTPPEASPSVAPTTEPSSSTPLSP